MKKLNTSKRKEQLFDGGCEGKSVEFEAGGLEQWRRKKVHGGIKVTHNYPRLELINLPLRSSQQLLGNDLALEGLWPKAPHLKRKPCTFFIARRR